MTEEATPEIAVGQDEVGRYRRLARTDGGLAVIAGNRIEKHWEDFIKNLPYINHQSNHGYTPNGLNRFYKGWVKPLMKMKTDYCGCKLSNFGSSEKLNFLNIRDIADFAVLGEGYIEHIFPGSTPERMNTEFAKRDINCGKTQYNPWDQNKKTFHGTFVAQIIPIDTRALGVNLLADERYSRFSMSLLGWNLPLDIIQRPESAAPMLRVAKTTRDHGINPLRFGTYYGDAPVDDIIARYGSDDGMLITMLMLGNGDDFSYQFTKEDIGNLHEDDYLARLLDFIGRNRSTPALGRITDFGMAMRAAEHDIDTDLLLSL